MQVSQVIVICLIIIAMIAIAVFAINVAGISGANSKCCCSCDYYDRKCGFDDWEYCNWVMFLGSVRNRQFNRWSDSLFKEQIQKG